MGSSIQISFCREARQNYENRRYFPTEIYAQDTTASRMSVIGIVCSAVRGKNCK